MNLYSLKIVTEPAVEPVTVELMKDHLRVDDTYDDTLVALYTAMAREYAEGYCWRSFISQTWDYKLDCFPSSDSAKILIPRCPLQSVTSITYVDTDGDTQTWSSSEYTVGTNTEPGFVVPAYDESYPSTRTQPEAVTIRFVGGYGDSPEDVPNKVKLAIMHLTAHYYENRQSNTVKAMADVPFSVKAILDMIKVKRY